MVVREKIEMDREGNESRAAAPPERNGRAAAALPYALRSPCSCVLYVLFFCRPIRKGPSWNETLSLFTNFKLYSGFIT
mgnify:CR=1 FL=1